MRSKRLQRRDFITLLGSAASWPLAARAQQNDPLRRIGVLMGFAENDPEAQSYITTVLRTLDALGWKVGDNIRCDYRWAGGNASRAGLFAKELIELQPDVIFAQGTPQVPILAQET